MKKILLMIVALLASLSAAAYTDFYLRGDHNNWGTGDQWKFKTHDGNNYYLVLSDAISDKPVKIANEGWDQNFGFGTENEAVNTDESKYLWTGDAAKNFKPNNWPVGTIVTFNKDNHVFEAFYPRTSFALRGQFKSGSWEDFDFTRTGNVYTATIEVTYGNGNFGITVRKDDGNQAFWIYGNGGNEQTLSNNGTVNLIPEVKKDNSETGKNVKLNLATGKKYVFTFDPANMTLSVVENTAVSGTVTLVGNFALLVEDHKSDTGANNAWCLVSDQSATDGRGIKGRFVKFGAWDDQTGFVENTSGDDYYLFKKQADGNYTATCDFMAARVNFRILADNVNIAPAAAYGETHKCYVDESGQARTYAGKAGDETNVFDVNSGVYNITYNPTTKAVTFRRMGNSAYYNEIINGTKTVYARGFNDWDNCDDNKKFTVMTQAEVLAKYQEYGLTLTEDRPILVLELDGLGTSDEFKFGTQEKKDWFWAMSCCKRALDGSLGEGYHSLPYDMWIGCAPIDGEDTNMKMAKDSGNRVAILLDPYTWDVMFFLLDKNKIPTLPKELYAFVHDGTDNVFLNNAVCYTLEPEREGSSRYTALIQLAESEQWISLAANDNSDEHPVNDNVRYTPGEYNKEANIYTDLENNADMPIMHSQTVSTDNNYLVYNVNDHYFVGYEKDNVSAKNGVANAQGRPMYAPAMVSGKTAKDAKAWNVKTHSDWSLNGEGVPGKYQLVVDMADNSLGLWRNTDNTTSIEEIGVENDAPARYYNLQGMEVGEPVEGVIYIVNRGGKITKELYR